MIHQLKINTKYFKAIAAGTKTFEVRDNVRGFRVGDFLALNELATIEHLGETGRCVIVEITYILDDTDYCKDGQVILGFQPCAIKKLNAPNAQQNLHMGAVPIYEASPEERKKHEA